MVYFFQTIIIFRLFILPNYSIVYSDPDDQSDDEDADKQMGDTETGADKYENRPRFKINKFLLTVLEIL